MKGFFCHGFRLVGILLTSLSCSISAYAGVSAIQQGEMIFQHGSHGITACASCHGTQAEGALGPRLAGLGQAYIVRQLKNFSTHDRKNHLMNTVARHMNEKEMFHVAAWIASRKPELSPGTPQVDFATMKLITAGDWSRGIPACIDCHANTLMGDGDEIPALAGQQQRYLIARLRQFKSLNPAAGKASGIMSNTIVRQLSDSEIVSLAKALATLNGRPVILPEQQSPAIQTTVQKIGKSVGKDHEHFTPPAESDIPASPPLAASIRHGEQIFMNTPAQAKAFVGRDTHLSCVHCHLNRGRLATAAPMWAAAVRYPLYRKKNHRVNTLAMRIQGCFRFSLNGTPPPATSDVMVDLLSYIHWLAKGLPTGIQPTVHGFPSIAKAEHEPDKIRGEALFSMRCSMCHGMDGQGKMRNGMVLFPPLWGSHSFNLGAGMHRVGKAAAFIKANMPYGAGGSLDNQDAWDIAAFVDSHPRPEDPRSHAVSK